jgi:Ca2+-binding RTX toxin-like protein
VGSAETDGNFIVIGGTGDDELTGGALGDTLDLSAGGNDTANGGGGGDAFNMLDKLTASDVLDGGADNDSLNVDGDYSAGMTFGAMTAVNFEGMAAAAGHDYDFTTHDATVASGITFSVLAGGLGAADDFLWNGAAETDGTFDVTAGSGNDTLAGGAGDDTLDGGAGIDDLTGGAGSDDLTGGAGIDRFHYAAVSQSASTTHDVVHGFTAADDFIDLHVAVTGYDGSVSSSIAINQATFDANLTVATAGAFALAPAGAHAILFFTGAEGGDLDGRSYLIVDANADAVYTGGLDYVIDVTGGDFSGLGVGNFI